MINSKSVRSYGDLMALSVIFAFVAVLSVGRSASAETVSQVVGMKNGFTPNKITIKLGDTVEWRNDSRGRHTVTADPALAQDSGNVVLPKGAPTFDSKELLPGKTFRFTFNVAGHYKYFCRYHEAMGMVGEIDVK